MTDLNDINNELNSLFWHIQSLKLNPNVEKELITHVNKISGMLTEFDEQEDKDSFPAMVISVEGVKEYSEEKYEMEYDVAIEIAKNLADRWEADYDYETFMQDGVKEEAEFLISKGRKGIKKIE